MYVVELVLKDCPISHKNVQDWWSLVLKDHPIGHKNVVSQDWWSLVTGSVALKMLDLLPGVCVLLRGGLVGVVSQDRFHCNFNIHY